MNATANAPAKPVTHQKNTVKSAARKRRPPTADEPDLLIQKDTTTVLQRHTMLLTTKQLHRCLFRRNPVLRAATPHMSRKQLDKISHLYPALCLKYIPEYTNDRDLNLGLEEDPLSPIWLSPERLNPAQVEFCVEKHPLDCLRKLTGKIPRDTLRELITEHFQKILKELKKANSQPLALALAPLLDDLPEYLQSELLQAAVAVAHVLARST